MSRIQQIEQDLQLLMREQKKLEKEIAADKNHDRRLVIYSSGNKTKWYVIIGGERKYLSKKQRDLAVLLAKIGWRKARLAEVRTEILACQQYLNACRSKTSHLEKLLSNQEYCVLLGIQDKSVEQWKNEPFSSNPSYPEALKLKTNTGVCVRSKSELLIAMMLEKYGIPYRYECLLETPAGSFFPDFTIMHPKTHKIYIWEHFGMMDSQSYASKAGAKVSIYLQMGYIPNENLLLTYETADYPLDLQEVENLILSKFV